MSAPVSREAISLPHESDGDIMNVLNGRILRAKDDYRFAADRSEQLRALSRLARLRAAREAMRG